MSELLVPKARAWIANHPGVISVEKLETFGCSRRDAYRLTDRGELAIVMPGVMRSTHWPLGPAQLMTAACCRCPAAAIALTTAAHEWKFRGVVPDGEINVEIPHGTSAALPGVIVHRTRRLDPVDIVVRRDGIRLTSPSRTLFDCADMFGRKRTASIMEQLINDRRGTFVTHASTVSRLGHSRRPGTRTMSAVIDSRPRWRAAMQSELEVLVLREIERRGLPTPELQHRCELAGGGVIRFDFAWPRCKVALEVDHPFWHAGEEPSAGDKHRDRKMATAGWLTVRITDLDVTAGLADAIADVATILATR